VEKGEAIQTKTKINKTCVIAIILGLLLTTITGSTLAQSASNLEITNLSDASINISNEDLQAMPPTTVYAELYCDGSLATSGNWTGILLSDLLFKAQQTPEVYSIHFTASDGYRVSIPIELALQPQIIIAYQQNGQPLAEGLRLILAGYNGADWISLITTITMSRSGADYPLGVSVGTGKINDLADAQSNPTPKALAPQQLSTPSNSSSVQVSSPTNVTISNEPVSKPQLTSYVGINYDTLIYGAEAIVLLIVVTTVILTYKRKRKL
jgi:DMSO/TMAO reductase YedYZ molybdopterin-dependent catalytic subunit